MAENIAQSLGNSGMYIGLIVALISLIPLLEMRAAIPLALIAANSLNDKIIAVICAYFGSLICAPFILILLKPFLNFLKRYKMFDNLAFGVEAIFQGKIANLSTINDKDELMKLEKRKLLSVAIFVAIPLPLTGVWSGAGISAFMNLKWYKAFFVIAIGNLFACLALLALCYIFKSYLDYVLWALFALAFIGVCIYSYKLYRHYRSQKE